MSTALFDDDRFLQIRESLRLKIGGDLVHVWSYPPNCEDRLVMKEIIDKFVQDLGVSNTRAFNARYENENEPERILPNRSVLPFSTDHALVKALQAIDYNIDDENVNGCADILHKLLYHLMYGIVSKSPQYEKAAWL